MARTRWPPGPVRPGLLPRPGRSDRQRRWVPKNLGPADRSFRRTTRMASADSEVRPEPRPLTIPPRQLIAREAGPKGYPHPPCRLWVRRVTAGAPCGCRTDLPSSASRALSSRLERTPLSPQIPTAPREKHGGSSGWALAGRAITGRSEWSGVALLRLGAALRFAVECRRQP